MSVAEDWTLRPRAPRLDIDLARTGPDTPGGKFMRRFWMPVYRAEDLPKGQAKPSFATLADLRKQYSM